MLPESTQIPLPFPVTLGVQYIEFDGTFVQVAHITNFVIVEHPESGFVLHVFVTGHHDMPTVMKSFPSKEHALLHMGIQTLQTPKLVR